MDVVTVSWSLRGVGSATFSWSPRGEETLHIRTTYVGDALSELVEAGIALGSGVRRTFATLLGEPVGHRIFLSGDQETVYVEIVRFEDPTSVEDRWNRGRVRWAGRVSTVLLVGAIRDMAGAVLRHHGLDDYQRRWGIAFPAARYEVLRSL